jgi:hypothetical protein
MPLVFEFGNFGIRTHDTLHGGREESGGEKGEEVTERELRHALNRRVNARRVRERRERDRRRRIDGEGERGREG